MFGIFNSGLFFFVEGILFVFAVYGFRIWMEDRGVVMTWWKWVLTICWLAVLCVTVAFVGTAIGELEYEAASKSAMIFGLTVIVTGVVLWRILNHGRSNPGEGS